MDIGLDAAADALHRDALVVDLHNDVLITMRATGLRLERRHWFHLPYHLGFWHTDLPRLRAGGPEDDIRAVLGENVLRVLEAHDARRGS